MEKDDIIDFFGSILPPEVTHAILSYLSPLDVVSASQVSQTFAGLLDSRGIWKRVVEEKFGPLDEQIFKGNIINWKRTFYHCSELQKWKKYFLTGQVENTFHSYNLTASDASIIDMKQKVGGTSTSRTFYQDRAKKKPFACLYSTRERDELLAYSLKYALIRSSAQLQLWDLTVDCKHTDEHKWKSAPNKDEICKKKCSFVRDTSTDTILSNLYWSVEACGVIFTTAESLVMIDLNTGEELSCAIKFEKYGNKMKPIKPVYGFTKTEQVLEVRVMNVNGVSMTFCHVSSVNGEFFVNLTTKRIHLFVDKACHLSWISKSLKVAVINAKGDQMRVVNIVEEQPKALAKYNFDKKTLGVVSSPEGHVLFIWHYNVMGAGNTYSYNIRAYLWEIGYLLGGISPVFLDFNLRPLSSCWQTDERSGKHKLFMEGVGIMEFSKIKL